MLPAEFPAAVAAACYRRCDFKGIPYFSEAYF